MKRTLFTLLTLALAIRGLYAQDLIIHKTDGTVVTMALNAIDSITFANSTGGQSLPSPGIPSVADIDGNIYNTVLIGDQCWMKENLATSTYKNGTPIPNVTESSDWLNLTTGAYVLYDNDVNWKDKYGALYNWYAVDDPNGLCPEGWHVPSDAEWTQLVNYVVAKGFPNQWDDPNGAGFALKSCRQVNSPLGGNCNTTEHPRWEEETWPPYPHGFDEFGFSAIPGGLRDDLAAFHNMGHYGFWWASTESSTPMVAYSSEAAKSSGAFTIWGYGKERGFAVRCLKD